MHNDEQKLQCVKIDNKPKVHFIEFRLNPSIFPTVWNKIYAINDVRYCSIDGIQVISSHSTHSFLVNEKKKKLKNRSSNL